MELTQEPLRKWHVELFKFVCIVVLSITITVLAYGLGYMHCYKEYAMQGIAALDRVAETSRKTHEIMDDLHKKEIFQTIKKEPKK